MSLPSEGLYGSLGINGTLIALLTEVSFDHDRESKEFSALGSVVTNDVLLGVNHYKVTAKRAYVDNTWGGFITGGSVLPGTLYTTSSKYVSGSFVCTKHTYDGIKAEAADPVMENLDFIMYNVTYS